MGSGVKGGRFYGNFPLLALGATTMPTPAAR